MYSKAHLQQFTTTGDEHGPDFHHLPNKSFSSGFAEQLLRKNISLVCFFSVWRISLLTGTAGVSFCGKSGW